MKDGLLDFLRDLYGHQAWADAESWRAFETHGAALQDKALWERLHHIHLVQRFFLAVVRGEDLRQLKVTKPDSYTPPALKLFARQFHAAAAEFLVAADAAALEQPVAIPWFRDPPLTLPVSQALTQAAMHSHYHRAQNVTRLRELGGTPPLTDYIYWLWKGRPAPEWL